MNGTVGMTLRLMQVALLVALGGCGAAVPSAESSGPRPFTVTEVTRFESPWAMDFLPGSGVRMTNAALVTEKAGKLWLVNVQTGARQEVSGVPQVAQYMFGFLRRL